MKRPTSVSLGAHEHTIEWCKKRIGKKSEPLLGRAHRYDNRIEVSTDCALSQQQSTLIHEILHHAFCDTPARHFAGWSDEVEEAIISAIEGPLLEVFVRPENRPVVAFLKRLVH